MARSPLLAPSSRWLPSSFLALIALAGCASELPEGDGDVAEAEESVLSTTADSDLDGIVDASDPAPNDPYNRSFAATGTLAHRERRSSVTSSSPSWDGLLYFAPKVRAGSNPAGYDYTVNVLRPEALFDPNDSTAYGLPNFGRSGVWSTAATFAHTEASTSHLAIFPEPAAGNNNPYRSECAAALTPVKDANGACLTYRFGLVGVETFDDTLSIPTALTLSYGTVVVQNPGTATSSVLFAGFDKATADFLYDSSSPPKPLCKYEPSISFDGRLLVWHGCVDNDPNASLLGPTMYSFNPVAGATTGWSTPRSIAKMYDVHGPGAGANEPKIDGVKFSDRYPIAKQRLLDADGAPIEDGHPGPYPWLSFDASEIFFPQVVVSAGGPTRSAMTAIGQRTGWRLQHIDGAINPSRSKLTVDPDGFVWGNAAEYPYLAAAYNNNALGLHSLSYQEFGATASDVSMSSNNWQRLFVGPVALSASMWSPFKDAVSPLPRDERAGVYGFLLSHSNRYVEVDLSAGEDPDLLLSLPMNEKISYDHAAIATTVSASRQVAQNLITLAQGKTIANDAGIHQAFQHSTSSTPDRAGGQHGTLGGGAKFPYEEHAAQATWSNYYATVTPGTTPVPTTGAAVSGDRIEGAVGNAVYFPRTGFVASTLSAASIAALTASHAGTTTLWFKEVSNTGSTSYPLFQGANLSVAVAAGAVSVTAGGTACSSPVVTSGKWHHVAVTRKWNGSSATAIELYLDGDLACSATASGDASLPGASAAVIVGPNVSGASTTDLRVLIDEVEIARNVRTASEIKTAALRSGSAPSSATATSVYAGGAAPNGLTRSAPIAPGSALSGAQVTALSDLGRQLFTDPLLSSNGTVSCSTCHDPRRAFADGRACGGATPCAFSAGVNGTLGARNAPGVGNRLFGAAQFWDGRAGSLEAQALGPITNPVEMANPSVDAVLTKIAPKYGASFTSVFGTSGVTARRLAAAIATYERTVLSGDSRYDRQLLTPGEARGQLLFFGKARCSSCHRGDNLTDELFHNPGIATSAAGADLGRMAVTGRESDRGRFKTASLRDVARTAPYYHDGRFATLTALVDFYNAGGDAGATNRDMAIHPLGLTAGEKKDLVAFLGALNGSTMARDAAGKPLPASPEIVVWGGSAAYWMVGWHYDDGGASPTVELSTTADFASPRSVSRAFSPAGTPTGYTGTTWQNCTFTPPADLAASPTLYARVVTAGRPSNVLKLK